MQGEVVAWTIMLRVEEVSAVREKVGGHEEKGVVTGWTAK